MLLTAVVHWYFLFASSYLPIVVGPFASSDECERVRAEMNRRTLYVISACWSGNK